MWSWIRAPYLVTCPTFGSLPDNVLLLDVWYFEGIYDISFLLCQKCLSPAKKKRINRAPCVCVCVSGSCQLWGSPVTFVRVEPNRTPNLPPPRLIVCAKKVHTIPSPCALGVPKPAHLLPTTEVAPAETQTLRAFDRQSYTPSVGIELTTTTRLKDVRSAN